MGDRFREFARIDSVRIENFRDGDVPNTVWVYLDFDGAGQGFGGLYLPEKHHRDLFLSSLRETCGVKSDKELLGQPVFALKNFGGWNDPIDALESGSTGKIFSIRAFREAITGQKQPSALEDKKNELRLSIEHLERRLRQVRLELESVESRYKEW